MTGRSWSPAISAALLALAAGCGSHGGGGGSTPTPTPAPYPAPHAALPRVLDGGGPILSAPVITAVTFPGDDYAPLIDDFTSRIGTSSWWASVTTGYGIGIGTATAPVHYDQPAPQAITRPQLETWLASQIDGSNPSFPTPVPGSVYLVFYPEGTVVTDSLLGPSCDNWYAFHTAFATTAGEVAYAVMPRCPAVADLSLLDVATADASHELVEAATDPVGNLAWYRTDAAGTSFDALTGFVGEVADLCIGEDYPFVETDDLPYLVARSWSNAAAEAGEDPCQPAFDPWFGAVPDLPDSFDVVLGGQPRAAKGVRVPVGGTRTVTLDLFSAEPLSGGFQVEAYDVETRSLGLEDPVLDLSFDRDHGANGDHLTLTIHVRHAPTMYPGELVVVEALRNGALHRWPFWVANQ